MRREASLSMNRKFSFRPGASSTSGESTIIIGSCTEGLNDLLASTRYVLLVESAVYEFANTVLSTLPSPIGVIKRSGGETCKSLSIVEQIYAELFKLGVDRNTLCLAIGGGAFLDLAGFVAATYLRGLSLVSIPTTLLAQVDASIGGKNGVDFNGYKNLIGTIRQPQRVILDVQTLKTLPDREYHSGLAEVVKAALIADSGFFDWLGENRQAILRHDKALIEEMIARAVHIKMVIVEQDEQERGERRKLNFGHTLGHALEVSSDLLHGEAVSVGMLLESKFALQNGWSDSRTHERLLQILEGFGLPTECPLPLHKLAEAIDKDKKRDGARLHLPVVSTVGVSSVIEVTMQQLQEYLR